MNFIDYCIETRNYSALSAISDYTKSFGRTNQDIEGDPYRRMLAARLNEIRKAVHARYENGFDKYGDGKRLKDKKDGLSTAYRQEAADTSAEMYRISARNPTRNPFRKRLLTPYRGEYTK